MTSSSFTGKNAVRGAVLTAALTMVSRVLGFLRDMAMTTVFGASAEFGSFAVAWALPNLFRRLFGEGAVSAAIQPALAHEQERHGLPAAHRLFARFHFVFLLGLILLVALGEVIILLLPAIFPDWATAGTNPMAIRLMALFFPYVLPICLTALASAPQHLSGRFTLPALAPALLNIIWISWLGWMGWQASDNAPSILLLPLGVFVGGVAQWLLQLPGLRLSGWPILPSRAGSDGRVRKTLRHFLPAMIGLLAVQVNVAVDLWLVRLLVSDEANTYTFLANRLLQLPLAILGIAAATGAMPLFAKMCAEGRMKEMSRALRSALESTLVVIVPAGLGLAILSPWVLEVLFEHGRFAAADTVMLSTTLRAYLFSLPAAALLGLLIRARHARLDLRGPALIAVVVIPLNLGLDIWLLPKYGPPAAGWATTASCWVQLLLLALGMKSLGMARVFSMGRLPRLLLPGFVVALCVGAFSYWANTQQHLPAGLIILIGIPLGGLVFSFTLRAVLPIEWNAIAPKKWNVGDGS
ncbi:MAG: murein biosynthesis integral membrane protein MurJ [Planctomycetes bacterium]|nr:murein biosynthesis integral membrane protein MurJ [Planctomycetota bacterium]MBT4028729.1 murein biosynthesis integral membrane protein MurJ [Planctomycetota bacterium]MBT4560227.1 murein biosynthesis integral membrane protein MurJ [Planctomycetota bacterium]MBT5100348.1 murein biosynthesis integral membrane protein MurJ [Planctomycetota bacterium]MBT5119690.1 murein biosynthesis integral membrane protein MurJ [Planctomycetota bacterium]